MEANIRENLYVASISKAIYRCFYYLTTLGRFFPLRTQGLSCHIQITSASRSSRLLWNSLFARSCYA